MDIQIARVLNFYDKVRVAVIEIIDQPIRVGDVIRIRGTETDFVQTVTMLQIENHKVDFVDEGEICVLGVTSPVQVGDMIYLVTKKNLL